MSGENIAWSIMTQSGIDIKSKILKRLWVNSLEKDAIRDGFANLRDGWDYYPYYQEAQTRQISDWLVGMNASPLYFFVLYGTNAVYSIGRATTQFVPWCISAILEIKKFSSFTPYVELPAAGYGQ